ncbi:MAG: hypothetical protein Q7T86_11420 [Hyphomicrobiaceae bacterium]|nr:hypothetical protein [Hyphomicrobiaceae bacterium]
MKATKRVWTSWAMVSIALAALALPAAAQQDMIDGAAPSGSDDATAPPVQEQPPAPDAGSGTTVIPRSEPPAGSTTAIDPAGPDQLQLVALLTADGQRIEQGMIWRIYAPLPEKGKVKLLSTHEEPSPKLTLKPGEYVVNAAFGRAYLTRKISLKPGTATIEQFVLNAGGLRVSAKVGEADAPGNTVRFNIYSDRDQQDNRRTIMMGAKPGVVVRLNAGIYQIESTYGDANATVRTDVTVEAGKLTETALKHAAARATFKLVARPGGEATADTQWRVETSSGQLVKENAGAFPTHMLAPGKYIAVAKHAGKVFKREFAVEDGSQQEIEVLME